MSSVDRQPIPQAGRTTARSSTFLVLNGWMFQCEERANRLYRTAYMVDLGMMRKLGTVNDVVHSMARYQTTIEVLGPIGIPTFFPTCKCDRTGWACDSLAIFPAFRVTNVVLTKRRLTVPRARARLPLRPPPSQLDDRTCGTDAANTNGKWVKRVAG